MLFYFLFGMSLFSFNDQFIQCEWDFLCNELIYSQTPVNEITSIHTSRLNLAPFSGEHSWTKLTSENSQLLTIKFDRLMKVVAISTEGNSFQNEFVMEYSISYGTDGFNYMDYKTFNGNFKVFRGNDNRNSLKKNKFEVPIIAKEIKIYPIRWKNRASMRVDLYGCIHDANYLYFNGSSLIEWNLKQNPISSVEEIISLRFKTSLANGIILYGCGTLGDYFSLQMHENKMILNIDLGSGLLTSLSVGSLLDDNNWHDVMISRHFKKVQLSVDRVSVHENIKGDFTTLNLNNIFYIGGVSNKQDGMVVFENFTGCIDNLYFNSSNINKQVKDIYSRNDEWMKKILKKSNVVFSCPEESLIPVAFTTESSRVDLPVYAGMKYFNLSFSFRTFEESGLLMYHKFQSVGHIKIYLQNGKILLQLKTGDNPLITLQNFDVAFNDGKWHNVKLSIESNKLTLIVNQLSSITTRLLSMTTGATIQFGGCISGFIGFIGCMKQITLNDFYETPANWKQEYTTNKTVINVCQLSDKCSPNPCKHNGICKQTWKEFSCDCDANYGGAVCQRALNPLNCEAYKLSNPTGQIEHIQIDIDGSGSLKPFPVTCLFHANGRIITELHHKNEKPTIVDGFQVEGSFVQDIIYDANSDQIEALIDRSTSCWQRIRYDCFRSKLLNSPSKEKDFKPFSWWVSHYNQKMDFWGDAVEGSRKCGCGVTGNCKNRTNWCNCDAGYYEWRFDEGVIKGKEYLPVKQLRFGDTGTLFDDKRGRYTLGQLQCEGDDILENVITFRKADAVLHLPTFNFNYETDINFKFRTTYQNGILLNSRGPEDEIRIELRDGKIIQLLYNIGDVPVNVMSESDTDLSNDEWHSVFVEINRKEITIIIDGNEYHKDRNLRESTLSLYLTSPLAIGGVADKQNPNGFVGCIGTLMINGNYIDLISFAKQNPYGVSIGCIGKCFSSPCLNNGTCIDRYDNYLCDCRWSSFKGPICADEIGVNMDGQTGIKYEFLGSWRSTLSENIRIGFTTTHPQGFLLGLFSNITGEYMTILVSNSGNLRISFDFGFERQELVLPLENFDRGLFHDLRIRRKQFGSTFVIQVDDYEPIEKYYNIKKSADAQFNNIQYLYIGRNESMKVGFLGCISRVEFDDIYPLKFLFKQNKPKNVNSFPGTPSEDFCGVEPPTHPPEPIELRPSLDLDIKKVEAAYHKINIAFVGSLLFIFSLLSVVITILAVKYVANRRAQYLTQEQLGADVALNADTSVLYSKRGHAVVKKREWFI